MLLLSWGTLCSSPDKKGWAAWFLPTSTPLFPPESETQAAWSHSVVVRTELARILQELRPTFHSLVHCSGNTSALSFSLASS